MANNWLTERTLRNTNEREMRAQQLNHYYFTLRNHRSDVRHELVCEVHIILSQIIPYAAQMKKI